jgi:xanthine dehydrogenase small subunit
MELFDVQGQLSAMAQRKHIRFVLDGEVVELADVDPTRTLLQYLREDLLRTGSKEGCAEGDCGACTVVLAELDRDADDLRLRAINSCIQFLPTLDGKELITVESLASDSRDLHPVQQAMLECHGSQCGFCTPGFVMSLFALFKSAEDPGRRQIDDALSGNLCRCTGYRPIIAAAKSMYRYSNDADWLRQSCAPPPTDRVAKLRELQSDDTLALDYDGRRYFAPKTASELAALLAANPGATLLAGGTDVGLWVTKQHRELDTVIYTGAVRELLELEVGESHIEIGAAVTFTDAMPVILEHYPRLEELLLRFSSPLIRNAGTVGGNVANGSPIGDSMPALMAADASVVLCSARGSRELPLDDFYHGYMDNDLAADEFLQAVRLPLPEPAAQLLSYKISKRFDQDISAVCAGFNIDVSGGTVNTIRIAYGGLAATTKRALNCEAALRGKPWNEQSIAAAMSALAKDFTPIDDMRASADYRLRVAQNLLRRLYADLGEDTGATLYDYGRTG